MTRAVYAVIGLAVLTASAEVPTPIRTQVNQILAAAHAKPENDRFAILLRLASVLRFHFPDMAKHLLLDAAGDLNAEDDSRRARLYRLMLDFDASEAARIAAGFEDKDVRYSAALGHCLENQDVSCGGKVLTEAHKAGSYRVSHTRWVIEQLAATDPLAARAAFEGVLQRFPAKSAGYLDVQILLDAAKAIAKVDSDLAKRACKAIEAAVRDPEFEDRSRQAVTAEFLINGKRIDTTSTRQTVLLQTQSLLRFGTFPHRTRIQFTAKHPSATAAVPPVQTRSLNRCSRAETHQSGTGPKQLYAGRPERPPL